MEAAINDSIDFSKIFHDVRIFCKKNCPNFSNFYELASEIKKI